MLVLVFVLSLPLSSPVQADVKEYRVPAFADFSGPYADLMKWTIPARDATIKWWNDTDGKKLGLKLTPKNYDTRYDASVVASMWPGILSELKPILLFGLGGPDVAALQQRLPKDKVAAIYSTPAYGYGWLPDQWLFHLRPTFVHEWMGALVWYINQNPAKKPVRVAFIASQASPAFIDMFNGVTHYFKNVLEPKGLAKIVDTEWIELQPVDISSQMKKIIDAKADVILGPGTTTMAAAVIRAQQLHGVSIPTIASPHMTIWPLAMAMKSFKPWEGHYVVAGHASVTEKDSKAYEFYKLLQSKYELKEDWNPVNMMALTQTLLALRAVEHAAKKVGADKLTGQAVYDALSSGTFTEEELMGLMPTLRYTKGAPFPTKDLKVKIETVKDGKYQLAAPGWIPIPPDITKW
jgi:branched-chain amino acid transport system substrate-binding protein